MVKYHLSFLYPACIWWPNLDWIFPACVSHFVCQSEIVVCEAFLIYSYDPLVIYQPLAQVILTAGGGVI